MFIKSQIRDPHSILLKNTVSIFFVLAFLIGSNLFFVKIAKAAFSLECAPSDPGSVSPTRIGSSSAIAVAVNTDRQWAQFVLTASNSVPGGSVSSSTNTQANAAQVTVQSSPATPEGTYGINISITGYIRNPDGTTTSESGSCVGLVSFAADPPPYPYPTPYTTPPGGGGGDGGDGGGGGTGSFSLSCSPITRSIDPGGSTTYTVTISSTGIFTETVIITAATPSNVRSETRTVLVGGTVTMPVIAEDNAAPGDYTIVFSGYSDSGISSEDSCSLHINAPVVYPTPTSYPTPSTPYSTPLLMDFGMRCDPPTRSIPQGGSTSYTIYVDRVGSFSSVVNLSISVTPVTANPPIAGLVISSLIPPGSTEAWVTTDGATTVGAYIVTVTGISGSIQHSCSAKLEITGNGSSCPPNCPSSYSTPVSSYPTPPPPYPTPTPNISTSDKDIIELNGIVNSNASSANGISEFPSKTFFNAGDIVRYRISILNSGTGAFTDVVIVDTFIRVQLTAQPKVKFEGCNGKLITPATGDTITFTLSTPIEPNNICSLSFNAVIVPPAGVTEGVYRFKNTAKISGSGISETVETPALPFLVSRDPKKEEVAP